MALPLQVLSEVYAADDKGVLGLSLEPKVALCMVLHKVADSREDVRDAARKMLDTLTRTAWQSRPPSGATASPLRILITCCCYNL